VIKKNPAFLPLLLVLGAHPNNALAQSPVPPLPEATESALGYKSVNEALAALRSMRGVVFTTENNWLIATDEANLTVWSFAPKGHSAFPAVVKRQAVAEGAGSRLTMSVLCESSKIACDNLVRTFAQLNNLPLNQ
jgi:hypothetical protein